MEYTSNAKMMLGYIDDDDEILDYDGQLDLSDDEDEEERESVQEYNQQYPATQEEKINWQEQIRMIHLRSHLNQLYGKVKDAQYVTDKTREELKKCRGQIRQFEEERDRLFNDIVNKESEGNQSAIHRVRAAHDRVCGELDAEQKLEMMLIDRLDQAEYDLALAEVERGKFLLAEDDLLHREHQLSKEKTDMAMVRLHKEELLARQAIVAKHKDDRTRRNVMKDAEMKHRKALDEAEKSHQRANKYLNKTMEKLKAREQQEEERYKANMDKKMDMLIKLKADITRNRENLKAIRARDKASENKQMKEEMEERQMIMANGGNPEEILLVKKRQNEFMQNKHHFDLEQKGKKTEIMQKILQEEENLKRRKKQQPYLWDTSVIDKKKRVGSHKMKPLKALDDYMQQSATDKDVEDNREREILERLDQAEEERMNTAEDNDLEGDHSLPVIRNASDSSADEYEEEPVNLAKPEFEGLWDAETKPYHIPKDNDFGTMKPVGGSKMDKEILMKTLDKTREGIVIQQVAAGREFTGCPFYSKPDVIHFKDFLVGKTYKKKVLLTNVSYTVNYIKFIDITERLKDFIKIQFDPPGQMSAGLTCEMMVTFKPMINEDLRGEVSFLTQTGPFQIPLVCSTKKCDLCLDTNTVDFGTAVIGETLKRSFTLINHGALSSKFDFFKVTGMKPRTMTTAVTSLGQMTVDSSRPISPDSVDGDKIKVVTSNTLTTSTKKKSEEELEKIPEAGESNTAQEGEVPAITEDNDAVDGQTEEITTEIHEHKQDRESEEPISPDLAVSEMDDYSTLDGMRVGPLVTGEIGPFSTIRLEIVWQPTIPGRVDSEFLISFSDPLSGPISVYGLANAIDVPVWVERQTVDLKICMFDRLYQDTITVNNRATTALRLKFEVCKELSDHLEMLPKTGYIQAQSQFSAQLKFLPRQSLFTEASKFFDPETGVLEAPMTIRVADQTTPVLFTVQAVVTTSDMEFDVADINFGHCTIHESVRKSIKLTNKSILPQQFGFVGLPEYVEVQPNDGFGTLLPLETLEVDVIFSPSKAKEYKLDLVCRSLINKDIKLSCVGVGVLTPLELSHQVIHLAATPLYDIASTTFHIINNHTSSNEFTHPVPRIGKGDIAPVGPTSFEFQVPADSPFSISPCVGTVLPGQKAQIQVRFTPTLSDEDIRQEALRLFLKQEAVREEREREEAALEKLEKEQQAPAAGKGKPKTSPKTTVQARSSKVSNVASATNSDATMTTSPRFDPEALTRDSLEYLAASASLLRLFKGQFKSYIVPCYVASGTTGNPGDLPYSIHNTLYLELHCPTVKPQVVVISDSGKRTVDFGDVSIGQTYPKSVTIQNISDQWVELKATALNPNGPFVMLNALRSLKPGATHTILLTFSPSHGQMFQEEFGIKTVTSTLHLTFKGHGVSPLVNLSIENSLFDLGAVLVGEYLEKPFKIQNTSSLSIDYVIKQDSLSQLRHKKAQGIPPFLQSTETNYVGTQNDCGRNVFDIVPAKGTIQAGETKEILVTFAPDHKSDLYSDGVRIELFDQEESYFFRLVGQAKPRVMFVDGTDPLVPNIESLALSHVHVDEDEGDGKGTVISPPALVTIRSVMKDDTFQPGIREIYAGCVRTMAVSQKKPGKSNGEFSLDGIQNLIQKGFTIEPQKGMVEAGTKKPIVFTWTPPAGYDPSITIEETATLTLRCDVLEQIHIMIRAMVVTE